MLYPELPKRPTGAGLGHSGFAAGHPGTTNAEASKKCRSFRESGILPLPTRSGTPPMVPVPEGSEAENDGVKYCPDCITAVNVTRQPPMTWFNAPGIFESTRCPRPKGRLYTPYAKNRRGTTLP